MSTEEKEQVSAAVPANAETQQAVEQAPPSGSGRVRWLVALAVCMLVAGVIVLWRRRAGGVLALLVGLLAFKKVAIVAAVAGFGAIATFFKRLFGRRTAA